MWALWDDLSLQLGFLARLWKNTLISTLTAELRAGTTTHSIGSQGHNGKHQRTKRLLKWLDVCERKFSVHFVDVRFSHTAPSLPVCKDVEGFLLFRLRISWVKDIEWMSPSCPDYSAFFGGYFWKSRGAFAFSGSFPVWLLGYSYQADGIARKEHAKIIEMFSFSTHFVSPNHSLSNFLFSIWF